MLFELLPLLRGLNEDVYQVEAKALNPAEKETWRAEYPGWVTLIEAQVNHRGFVVTNALMKQPISFTYYSVMRQGITAVNPDMWLTIYDDPTTRYMLVYGPRPYYRAVRRDDYFQLQSPTVDPATGAGVATAQTINLFRVRYIYIIDEPEFRKSLRELLTVPELLDKIDLLNENTYYLAVALGGQPTKPPVAEEPRPRREEGPPPPREEPEVFDPSLLRRRRQGGGY